MHHAACRSEDYTEGRSDGPARRSDVRRWPTRRTPMAKADPADVLSTVARLVAEAPSLRDVVSRLAVSLRASIPFERLHVLRLDRADSFVLYVARETGEIEMTEHRVGDSATPLDAAGDAAQSRLLCTVRQGARVHGALWLTSGSRTRSVPRTRSGE